MLENSRNSEELNFIFEQLKMKIKNREDAIKAFNEKFKMLLCNIEEKLSMQKIGLEDEDLKGLSQMVFSKLKEILSENKNKNFDPLLKSDFPSLHLLIHSA